MESFFLQPGFRFHPTDVELVMYYLKRKVNGKRFRFNAIAEVKLYEFAPWELKDKSCLPSRDLEWFFFCPRDQKYGSRKRTNRTTNHGFWKTTGDDKTIFHHSKTVGSRRTLIFYKGRGNRTDWVMHEYRIEDDGLINAGFCKDSYVVCKIFKKSGRSPKNGEQHGAPFNEDEFDDDDCDRSGTSMIVSLAEPISTAQWPEINDNLPINSIIESTDGPVLIETQDSILDYDDTDFFNVDEIHVKDESCNEANLDASIPQDNGNKDKIWDGYEIFGDLKEIISSKELDAGKEYCLDKIQYAYDRGDIFSAVREGFFLEMDDLLQPMQADPFDSGRTGNLDIHGSTLTMPDSEDYRSQSNWEPQGSLQDLPM